MIDDDGGWIDEENDRVGWWWCLHCERVNHGRKPDDCPHRGCDGGWIDMWSWDSIRDGEGSGDYPLYPDLGMVYPMYAATRDGQRAAYPAGSEVTP